MITWSNYHGEDYKRLKGPVSNIPLKPIFQQTVHFITSQSTTGARPNSTRSQLIGFIHPLCWIFYFFQILSRKMSQHLPTLLTGNMA